MPKISLSDFADVLIKERALGNYFVSGLIIRKDDNVQTIKETSSQLPENIIVEISEKSDDSEIISGFKSAFENKKWILVSLKDGHLSPLWREQLTRLRDSNSIFIQGETAETTFYAEQPEETRIAVVVDEKNIKDINYSEFLNLFRPITEI
ncbi:hypothetical protein HZB04_02525 [Candidatus Wolfebacteria bacterium]|nr:hypothetical protein [Candidatus Wolfebacteria bacterium]